MLQYVILTEVSALSAVFFFPCNSRHLSSSLLFHFSSPADLLRLLFSFRHNGRNIRILSYMSITCMFFCHFSILEIDTVTPSRSEVSAANYYYFSWLISLQIMFSIHCLVYKTVKRVLELAAMSANVSFCPTNSPKPNDAQSATM